jgi:Ca2+-binding EF-hand superfamily protein
MFKMFDRSKFACIDFKEFCLALAIICLGGFHSKLRFVFDLFDYNKDGNLDKKEQISMLQAAAAMTLGDAHGEAVRTQWVTHQIAKLALIE